MTNYMVSFYYWLLLLPAFSITQILIGIHSQNRILWLPIGLLLIAFIKVKNLGKYQIALILLNLYFVLYYLVARINEWESLIYFGYLITFLLLSITCMFVEADTKKFLKFFKIFFICNILYVIFQLIILNIGLESLSMIHSNLPAQSQYSIPVFLEKPFYRFTGLFNESSPFCFYLSIVFCFFVAIKGDFSIYKNLALCFLAISGSKFAYIFLLLHYCFFSKSKALKFILLGVSIFIAYYIIIDLQYLINITEGQFTSIIARMSGFDLNYEQLGILGNGLGKSSEGELDLNMYSILLNGFGYTSIIISMCIILFYLSIKNRNKKYFIIPFLVATLSNGSLLIFQYTLLAYCLVYLDKERDSNKSL